MSNARSRARTPSSHPPCDLAPTLGQLADASDDGDAGVARASATVSDARSAVTTRMRMTRAGDLEMCRRRDGRLCGARTRRRLVSKESLKSFRLKLACITYRRARASKASVY